MNEIRTLAYHPRFSQCDKVSAGLFGTPKWRSRTGFILTLAGRGRFSFLGPLGTLSNILDILGRPRSVLAPYNPLAGSGPGS